MGHPAPSTRHRLLRWTVGLLAAALALAALAAATLDAGRQAWRDWRQERSLINRLQAVQPPHATPAQPCLMTDTSGTSARVLLVLGQSNAGNHGAEDGPATVPGPGPLQVFTGSGCQPAGDPVPGGTGRHASIWSSLSAALAQRGDARPVVLALLAVDGTRIADWTRPGSPLVNRLDQLLAQMQAAGVRPEAVLWQQGEADALAGTSTADYAARFLQLRDRLRAAGVTAPIHLAASTRCKHADPAAVQAARHQLVQRFTDLRHGADTDSLQGDMRVGGCHFSRQGLGKAAALWAQVLQPAATPAR